MLLAGQEISHILAYLPELATCPIRAIPLYFFL